MQLKLVLIVILLWFVNLNSRVQPHSQNKNIKFKDYQNLIKRFTDSQESKEVKKEAEKVAPEVTKKSLVNFILKDHEKLTINLLDLTSGAKFSLLHAKDQIYEIPSECVMGAMNSIINNAKGKESEHLIDSGKSHSMFPLSTELSSSKSDRKQFWFMVLDSSLASSKFGQENNHLEAGDNILCRHTKLENNAWLEPHTDKANQPMLKERKYKPLTTWFPRLTENASDRGNLAAGNITTTIAAVAALETTAGAIKEVDSGTTQTNLSIRKRSFNVFGN